jgi:hypothetical protein
MKLSHLLALALASLALSTPAAACRDGDKMADAAYDAKHASHAAATVKSSKAAPTAVKWDAVDPKSLERVRVKAKKDALPRDVPAEKQ